MWSYQEQSEEILIMFWRDEPLYVAIYSDDFW